MNAVDFVFTASAVTQTKTVPSPGIVEAIQVDGPSGAVTVAVKAIAGGVTQTLYSKGTPVEGCFYVRTRMQTIAGADNSGAGEFTNFIIPPNGVLQVTASGTWTGNIRVILR